MDHFEKITSNQGWCRESQRILSETSLSASFISEFHTYWTVAGHHIRNQIGDDKILVYLLRRVLPKYEGNTLTLFRGDNCDRFNSGRIGLCWTSKIEIARMFGSGLNAVENGGVLLQSSFSSCSIISGPSKHSNYLGEKEFTVDPFKVENILVLESYPPIY